MKTFSKNTKAFIMAAAMVASLLLPTTTNGQNGSDGFFNSTNSDEYKGRSMFSGNVNNQTFGQNYGTTFGQNTGQNESPLGSGLLIMTIAGASYVCFKKKED